MYYQLRISKLGDLTSEIKSEILKTAVPGNVNDIRIFEPEHMKELRTLVDKLLNTHKPDEKTLNKAAYQHSIERNDWIRRIAAKTGFPLPEIEDALNHLTKDLPGDEAEEIKSLFLIKKPRYES